MADRSMNVNQHGRDRELAGIVEKVPPTPRSKARSSPRARTPSVAAPISRCWNGMARYTPGMVKTKAREGRRRICVLTRAANCRSSTGGSRLRQAVVCALIGTAMAGFRTGAGPAINASPATIRKRGLGLPEIKIGLFPPAGGTQRIARHDAAGRWLQFLLKATSLRSTAPRP